MDSGYLVGLSEMSLMFEDFAIPWIGAVKNSGGDFEIGFAKYHCSYKNYLIYRLTATIKI